MPRTARAEKDAASGKKWIELAPEQELRRALLGSLLWNENTTISGVSISDKIRQNISKIDTSIVCDLAIEARNVHHLRFAPLALVREMARSEKHKKSVAKIMPEIIKRPDEMVKFVELYWKEKRQPLSNQVKKGLASAFPKFNEYQLAKYNQDGPVKLRDVLFLSHATPRDPEQEALWKRLIANELTTPDTWEVEISAKGNNKDTWERLLREGKLGALAILKNIRNMSQCGVSQKLLEESIQNHKKLNEVFPYRFITAADQVPAQRALLEKAMLKNLDSIAKIPGKTVLAVDLSGSMNSPLGKSGVSNKDAACSMAILLAGSCENIKVYATAGNDGRRIHATDECAVKQGFAMRDALLKKEGELGGGGIFLAQCMDYMAAREKDVDRTIIITDEQDCDNKANPAAANAFGKRNYLINISKNDNGIGYGDKWIHIDGFSESVIKYISEYEKIFKGTQDE